jgi:hypothetical protein
VLLCLSPGIHLNNKKNDDEENESECFSGKRQTIKNDVNFFSIFILSLSSFSISPSSTQGDLNNSAMPCIEFKFSNNNNSILTSNLSFGTKYPMSVESEASSALNSLVSTNAPLQTTLVSVKAQEDNFRAFLLLPTSIWKVFSFP